jgi:hypothetical protein
MWKNKGTRKQIGLSGTELHYFSLSYAQNILLKTLAYQD